MRPLRGTSLIDVVVGSALVLIVFMGLFGILRASVQVSGLAKLKAAATEIASSQMEYIRSLEYDDVGTAGGIPTGLIPQETTTTNAGLSFAMRTYIGYADDPADGLGAADTNSITTDYKRAKVSVTYTVEGVDREVTLVTSIVPEGIESTSGGGTLLIRAVDAVGLPVSGAEVHIENSDVSPAIDLLTFTDTTGYVNLPGAPTSTEYRIEVTKDGYSTAQTYARDATNQNPTPGYLTVVGGSTTSSTFAIDVLASLLLRTFSPIVAALWSDPFDDSSLLSSSVNVVVNGGALSLVSNEGSHVGTGSAESVAVSPPYLSLWTSASSTMSVPVSTSLRLYVLDGAGTLLPDAVLPGNSVGFTDTIDLSTVSTSTYPALKLRAELSTGDPAFSPSLSLWQIGYDRGPLPLPNVSFTLTGGKTIGSTGAGDPLYKTTVAASTGSTASTTLSLEWDSYTLLVPGYTILSENPLSPFELLPGTTLDASVILE